jgi:hypothetical protein
MALLGTPSWKILIDKNSVEQIKREVSAAAAAEGAAGLMRVADRAQSLLTQLFQSRGQEFLAGLWTHTPVVKDAMGGLAVEVYSKAEEMTFYARTGKDRVRSPRYPVAGKALLGMLESGVKPHVIKGRGGKTMVFDAAAGVHASIFRGSRVRKKLGVQELSFLGPSPDTALHLKVVNHPGFAGNRFVATARRMIEQGLAIEVNGIASRISARFA